MPDLSCSCSFQILLTLCLFYILLRKTLDLILIQMSSCKENIAIFFLIFLLHWKTISGRNAGGNCSATFPVVIDSFLWSVLFPCWSSSLICWSCVNKGLKLVMDISGLWRTKQSFQRLQYLHKCPTKLKGKLLLRLKYPGRGSGRESRGKELLAFGQHWSWKTSFITVPCYITYSFWVCVNFLSWKIGLTGKNNFCLFPRTRHEHVLLIQGLFF